jgi:hypothetical protein
VALSGIIQDGPHALGGLPHYLLGLEPYATRQIAPDQDEAFGEIFLTRLGHTGRVIVANQIQLN